ncbi:chromosome segregation protein SMC [Hyphomonas oceanitis]|uniref:Chromosome partition protein Smc n=1 Tax=Hyphomonas oceanitis SCH89 TaxID=1280953 RepID=A0A059G874_9PROT|nr:chromosome segregation protein SMC [Hyphomonas oceanitis]KDA03052.1 chromosome segregation protein SMC [Hyphomonas oceanitis SCH89]
MQITELRIAGFKSFVDPQTVPVEPGLTGIVGPNGCGKSNLLEALRWAMGASSAKAMRGGEMDDLIFSGAQGRPARETAEVTLVLDNSKRTAPPEFNSSDTLEIVRKLRRGAGTSYKLNGRTVRGKDIQLLFADASTGANSPALVRQGQISELIGSKPQNRRRILEEAAGIAGLNTRRHEAELKLNGAESNLERLTEVSAEVERQLASLKRQAGKARKYKRLSDEIHALDALVAHLRWSEAKLACDIAREKLEESRRAVEDLTRRDAICERERIEASEGLGPLREAESVASAKLGQARIALARLETERKVAADAHARLEAEAARLIEDLEREQAAKAEAEAATQNARNELSALPVMDEARNDEIEAEIRARLEAARSQLSAAEEAADNAQAALSEVRARRKASEENVGAQTRRRDQITSDINRLTTEMASLEDAVSLVRKLKDAKDAEAQSEQALQDAETAVEAAEARLTETRAAEADAQPPRDAADKDVRALEAEIAGLQKLLRKPDGPSAPPVIDRIRTRDGYEKAVAAALGDDIEAPTDRSAAMFWSGAAAATQSLPDGATALSEFVEAPSELAARLSQCGVAAAEDGARLMAELKPGQRLVSREGHLWRWDGFTRTPDAPVSAAARLEQQARLEAAQKEIGPLQAELENHTRTLTKARDARLAAEEALRGLRQTIAPAQRSLSEARTRVTEASQASERAAMKRDTAGEALARANADLAVVKEALSLMSPQSSAEEESTLEERLTEARMGVTRARDAEIEARGQLTDITRGREQAANRRAGLERDVETWTTRAIAAGERVERLVQRRASAASEAIAAKSRPEELAIEIEAMAADVERLEAERKRIADQLSEKETAAREAETAARQAAVAASESRETLAGWSVKLETAEGRLEESVEIARNSFQRTPEGLLAIAESGLDEAEMGEFTPRDAERKVEDLRRERDQLGGVNMNAEEEAEELETRLGSQVHEKEDLTAAIAKLREGVDALNAEGRERLLAAFETVNEHFKALFTALFRGGQAELRLVDAEDPLNAGLEIFAQPPGKKLGTLNLMSGGEQALTAAALIFAVFLSRPAPICVLDEVDAPLDDANVDRFCNMLNEMRQRTDTRFVVITHNPVTMSRMDRLFGVTMREQGVSKLVSVDLEAAEQLVAAE